MNKILILAFCFICMHSFSYAKEYGNISGKYQNENGNTAIELVSKNSEQFYIQGLNGNYLGNYDLNKERIVYENKNHKLTITILNDFVLIVKEENYNEATGIYTNSIGTYYKEN